LVFTGGIGENAAPVRRRICDGLQFLGIELDESLNQRNAPRISLDRARVVTRVIHTDEEFVIADLTAELVRMSEHGAGT
jgi:acetate kinase